MKIPSLILLAKSNKKEVVASRLVCKDTKKAVYSNVKDAVSPFTGESYLKASGREVTLGEDILATFKEVATCPSCKTVMLASEDFTKANPTFHCVVCNEGITVEETIAAEEVKAEDLLAEPKEEEAEEEIIIINDNPDSEVESEMSWENESEVKEEIHSEEVPAVMEECEIKEESKEGMLEESKSEEVAEIVEEAKKDSEEEIKEEIVSEEPKEELHEEIKDESISEPEMKAEEVPSTEELHEEVVCEEPKEVTEVIEAPETQLVIEINNPESVVVAPEELNSEDLPEDLVETLEGANEQGFDIPESIYTANLNYNLAHFLTKAEYKDKIELIASSLNEETPSLYIMVNQLPVAVAEFSNASEAVKSMFSDKELVMRSLQVTLANCEASETGLRLKDFGIRAITTPIITEKAAVASNLVKAAKALEENYKKKEAEMFNVWRESFTTSALMYCKNLQKKSSLGKTKSLITKASITETLRSVGIQNADVIVEEAFKRGIQRDYAVIVEEALSLYSKTPEARKEVRDFVADADYFAEASLGSIQANSAEQSAHESVSSFSEEADVNVNIASLADLIRKRAI